MSKSIAMLNDEMNTVLSDDDFSVIEDAISVHLNEHNDVSDREKAFLESIVEYMKREG